jgi:hypothetical protein
LCEDGKCQWFVCFVRDTCFELKHAYNALGKSLPALQIVMP